MDPNQTQQQPIVQAPIQQVPVTSVPQQAPQTAPISPQQPSSNKNIFILLGLVILIIIVAGSSVFVLMNVKKQTAEIPVTLLTPNPTTVIPLLSPTPTPDNSTLETIDLVDPATDVANIKKDLSNL